MSERMKVLLTFALLGFLAGILANLAYHTVIPAIIAAFPTLLQAEWVLSGFAGAFLTIVVVVIWAYFTRSKHE